MKYVMLETKGRGLKQYIPVIFPGFLVHSLVADYMMVALREHDLDCKVRSAGEIRFGLSTTCFGGSSTLDVMSHEDDAGIIDHFDYSHGLGEDDGTSEFVAAVVAKAYAERQDGEPFEHPNLDRDPVLEKLQKPNYGDERVVDGQTQFFGVNGNWNPR